MRIVKINTSAYSEEDFLLLTNLTDTQIKKVIKPMVKKERDEDFIYSNEDYYWSLKDAYPNDFVLMYEDDGVEELSF
jgi:hypothetical protein